MIEVEHLTKRFPTQVAVSDVSFTVRPGEIVGFLGPNGAGKTTAMRMLTAFLPPTEGVARVAGFDVVSRSMDARAHLGYLPESAALYPEMRVSEYLAYRARLEGIRGADVRKRVNDVIASCLLEEVVGRKVENLSRGYRQRTALAGALVHQPPVLILDEPTVGLDPEHRDRLWSLLEQQRRTLGTTILFSTHYLAEADSSDRVVLLARGRVVASDSPAALRATIGAEVAEIEGPGAERLVKALRGLGAVITAVLTERGFRVGLRNSREAVVELAGTAPGIERFTLRPAMLEDVYFARTQVTP